MTIKEGPYRTPDVPSEEPLSATHNWQLANLEKQRMQEERRKDRERREIESNRARGAFSAWWDAYKAMLTNPGAVTLFVRKSIREEADMAETNFRERREQLIAEIARIWEGWSDE